MSNAWDTAIAAVTPSVRNRWRLDEMEGTTVSDTGDRLVFIDSTVPNTSELPGVEVRP